MGRELTEQMIEDFRPYIKDPESFAAQVLEETAVCGDVTRIETIEKNGAVVEKLYYREGFEGPRWELPVSVLERRFV